MDRKKIVIKLKRRLDNLSLQQTRVWFEIDAAESKIEKKELRDEALRISGRILELLELVGLLSEEAE